MGEIIERSDKRDAQTEWSGVVVTVASVESIAPPGKTNLPGMKAAFGPRCPINTEGEDETSRTIIIVAASRILILFFTLNQDSSKPCIRRDH